MFSKKEFEQIFDEYFDDVVSFLYIYASDKADIKDWAQETFIKMWKNRDSIDFNHKGFRCYLLKTARHLALSHLRREKRYGMWLEENLVFLLDLHSTDNSVLDIHHDFSETYDDAISRIPPRAQRAYLLSREDGLTYREISNVMDISIKAVEANISTALKILREELKVFRG